MANFYRPQRSPRLMLVEDSPSEVMLFRRTLSRLGAAIDVTVCPSAEAAHLKLMEMVGEAPDQRPDLVVTDINLPGKSGLDLVREIKGTPELRSLPCLVFSTSSAESDISAAYDALASGYLTKPIMPNDYDDAIRTLTTYWFGLMQSPSASWAPLPVAPGRQALTSKH